MLRHLALSVALLTSAVPVAAQPAIGASPTPARPAPIAPPASPAQPPAPALTPAPPPPTVPDAIDSPAADPERSAGEAAPDLDGEFGPAIVVEDIVLIGNRITDDGVILRALPLARGQRLRAGDPRLTSARFKVLALGYFRDVSLALTKGSARGRVILTVTVVERGTLVLDRMWFGSSAYSPWWAGLDVTERNFLGSGVSVGGGAVFADHGGVEGARDQWGSELRVGLSGIAGSRWGVHAGLFQQHGSEPYRVAGDGDSHDLDDFRAFSYRRRGLRAGTRFQARPNLGLSAELRVEQLDASLPTDPARTLPDGSVVAVDLGLLPDTSAVASLAVGLDRDTRDDPVLPHRGHRVQAQLEVAASALVGDYDYAAGLVRAERWWPVGRRHALAVRAAGGLILGEAPRFDRIHVADLDRLLTPRVMGMTVATTPALDLLGTRNGDAIYGDLGGNLIVEWAYRWFRRPRSIFGGDVFVAAGAWGLSSPDHHPGEGSTWSALPVDLILDAGVRIDTELGVFELTIANALGRVPRW